VSLSSGKKIKKNSCPIQTNVLNFRMKQLFRRRKMTVLQDNNTNSGSDKSVQDRLLDAAEELFCEHGFEGTSIRDLTARAQCNIAAVNYHFGGKRQLYIEMFRRHTTELVNRQMANLREVMRSENPTLEQLLKKTVETGLSTLAGRDSRNSLLMLMVREFLNPQLKKEMLVNEVFGEARSSFCDAIMQLCPGISRDRAMRCLLTIDGLVLHPLIFWEFYNEFSPDLKLEDLVEHIVQIATAGIQAVAKGNN